MSSGATSDLCGIHRPGSRISKLLYSARISLDGYIAGLDRVLGANVSKQCLEAGLLDEILVFVAPALLGDGVPLFRHAGGTNVGLEPIDPQGRGSTSLWFRVARPAAETAS